LVNLKGKRGHATRVYRVLQLVQKAGIDSPQGDQSCSALATKFSHGRILVANLDFIGNQDRRLAMLNLRAKGKSQFDAMTIAIRHANRGNEGGIVAG
jgi:hypothetical protein